MITITPTNEKILRGLATYKFLSTEQIQRLYAINHKQQVYTNLKQLHDKKFIDSVIYGAVGRVGTTTKLHFLSYTGAKTLAKIPDVGEIKYPKSTSTMFKNDFYHRMHTIDTMISFDTYLGQSTHIKLFCDVYFDSIGSQKSEILKNTSKTNIRLSPDSTITPDIIFATQSINKEKCLFVLEMSNGKDTGRTTQQIRNNLVAMYEGKTSEKYSLQEMPILLVVFEHEAHKEGVKNAMIKNNFLEVFEDCDKYVFFALHQNIIEDWNCWENIHSEKSVLFK